MKQRRCCEKGEKITSTLVFVYDMRINETRFRRRDTYENNNMLRYCEKALAIARPDLCTAPLIGKPKSDDPICHCRSYGANLRKLQSVYDETRLTFTVCTDFIQSVLTIIGAICIANEYRVEIPTQ